MNRKTKIPKIYANRSFRIPLCDECGKEMVTFRQQWVCNNCMKIPVESIGGKVTETSFGELFPNRAARRNK